MKENMECKHYIKKIYERHKGQMDSKSMLGNRK